MSVNIDVSYVYGVLVNSWEEVEAFVKTHNDKLYKLIVRRNDEYATAMQRLSERVDERRHNIVNNNDDNERHHHYPREIANSRTEEELNRMWQILQERRKFDRMINIREDLRNRWIVHNISLFMLNSSKALMMRKFIIGIELMDEIPSDFHDRMMNEVVTAQEHIEAQCDAMKTTYAKDFEILHELGTPEVYTVGAICYWDY